MQPHACPDGISASIHPGRGNAQPVLLTIFQTLAGAMTPIPKSGGVKKVCNADRWAKPPMFATLETQVEEEDSSHPQGTFCRCPVGFGRKSMTATGRPLPFSHEWLLRSVLPTLTDNCHRSSRKPARQIENSGRSCDPALAKTNAILEHSETSRMQALLGARAIHCEPAVGSKYQNCWQSEYSDPKHHR